MNKILTLTALATVVLVSSLVAYFSVTKSPSPTPSIPADKEEIKFETVSKQQVSDHSQKQNYVINSSQEWEQLWDKITSPTAQAFPTPLDFEKETVVAVFQGLRSSAGYAIEVTRIVRVSNTIEVFVTQTSPGKSCLTAQVITTPYHLVKIEKFTGDIKFITQENIHECTAG